MRQWLHVQVLVPVGDASGPTGPDRNLELFFVEHVMKEFPTYSMGQPKQFGVLINGKKMDLRDALQEKEIATQAASAKYTMKETGAHVFFLEPTAYWDRDEKALITYCTKVILNSCEADLPTESKLGWENYEGWDALVGFPVEIETLVQCTSLWTNSVFRGIVRVNGDSAPLVRVEVEYFNSDQAVTIPNNSFVPQILKTNENTEGDDRVYVSEERFEAKGEYQGKDSKAVFWNPSRTPEWAGLRGPSQGSTRPTGRARTRCVGSRWMQVRGTSCYA